MRIPLQIANSFFVASGVLSDVGVPLSVAGKTFGDVGVLLFVASVIFRDAKG